MPSRERHGTAGPWELRAHLCFPERTEREHVTRSEALKSKRPPALTLGNSGETKGNEWIEIVDGDRTLNLVEDYSHGKNNESDLSLQNEKNLELCVKLNIIYI